MFKLLFAHLFQFTGISVISQSNANQRDRQREIEIEIDRLQIKSAQLTFGRTLI